MTTVHRHPLAGTRHLVDPTKDGLVEGAKALRGVISWRCFAAVGRAALRVSPTEILSRADARLSVDFVFHPDRDSDFGQAHLMAQRTTDAGTLPLTDESGRALFGGASAHPQRARCERSGRWLVIEIDGDANTSGCRLLAVFDCCERPAGRFGERDSEAVGAVGTAETAPLVYVVTDLFTRLGVPGGRYDRPEGRIANAR